MRRKMCIYKCMLNVYKNQQSQQTGSRNLTGPKTLPTIWHTYMKLVTKYQISAINSYWEKCDEKYLGWTEGRTDRVKTVYPPPPLGSRGIIITVTQYFLHVSVYKNLPKSKLAISVNVAVNLGLLIFLIK